MRSPDLLSSEADAVYGRTRLGPTAFIPGPPSVVAKIVREIHRVVRGGRAAVATDIADVFVSTIRPKYKAAVL